MSEKSISRRRFVGMALTGAAVAALGGCGSPRGTQGGADDAGSASQVEGSGEASPDAENALVVCFSWSGNTLQVAQRISEVTSCELFRIEPVVPYTDDYDEMLVIARDEQAAGELPEFAGEIEGWGDVSAVFIGFPTWWNHLPQIVLSFLAAYDCSGKVIYPFNTHSGSGFASCLLDMEEACPDAQILEGLSLTGAGVAQQLGQVDDWLAKL